MNFFCRQIWVVCTLAIFLMAGGQRIHACVDVTCCEESSSRSEPTCPDEQSDCPAGHCCHCLACSSATMEDSAGFLFMPGASGRFTVSDETSDEGFRKEIDYPPRLS